MAPRGSAGHGPTEKQKTKQAFQRIRISTVDEAPPFMKLPLLIGGYRLNYSHHDAIASIFDIHLDTVNIWSHLLGFIYFAWAMKQTYYYLDTEGAGWMDYLLFTVFLLGAQFQMAASAVYHTFRCVSPAIDNILLRIDLGGIAVMIIGAYALGLGQGFACNGTLFAMYLGGLLAILSIAGVMASWPDFQRPEYDDIRNAIFGCAVGFGAMPVAHWAMLSHCDEACRDTLFAGYWGMMAFYGIGYLIFMTRVPERWYPGLFDTLGASHQLWHVCVWAAAAVWLQSMTTYRRWKSVKEAECLDPAMWGLPYNGTLLDI